MIRKAWEYVHITDFPVTVPNWSRRFKVKNQKSHTMSASLIKYQAMMSCTRLIRYLGREDGGVQTDSDQDLDPKRKT